MKMEKKRPRGVVIFAILFMLVPLNVVIEFIGEVPFYGFRELVPTYFGPFISSVFFIVLSIGIFKLKEWARAICVWGSILFFIWGWTCFLVGWNPLGVMGLGELVYIIYPTIVGIPTLFYFTRPKVKEQFKRKKIANT